MNDIFKGPVYDFLVNKSINNKGDWGGNGGTLDASTPQNLENSKKGNTFMREFLQSISPKNIIETGTNYGSFSFTCYETLSDFNLYTCDNYDSDGSGCPSEECIDFINNHYNDNKVKYYNKTSWDFLDEIKKLNIKFDLAWLDSDHQYRFLKQELDTVSTMGVEYIMVDDFWYERNIQMAVFDFLKENKEYRFHSFSNIREEIGSITILQKTGKNQSLHYESDSER